MSTADSSAPSGDRSKFDGLFRQARPLLLSQTHQRDVPPVEGGRWPVSVVLFPDRAMTAALERVMHEAVRMAGQRHFHTGLAGSAHFTVRALEKYRDAIGPDDVPVERYCAALRAAAARSHPIGLRVVGLTLASNGVIACAIPTDTAAGQFATTLASELGPDSWREADFHRDIWYSTVVHFADDIARPQQLVDWVADRRDLDLGITITNTVHLVRFRHDAWDGRPLMRPEPLGEATLAGSTRWSPPAQQA
ncbi:MAG: hypothetical protein ACR2KJ_06370 [Jatrophihabitans sp.]